MNKEAEPIGEDTFGVRIVVREIWTFFVLLGEALFRRGSRLASYSTIFIICIQPIHPSIGRVYDTTHRLHVDMIASTRRGRRPFIAFALFGVPYKTVEYPTLGNNLLLHGIFFFAPSWQLRVGKRRLAQWLCFITLQTEP